MFREFQKNKEVRRKNRSRRPKAKVLALLLIFCMVLTTACTGQGGNSIKAPVKVEYFVQNNLEFETVSISKTKDLGDGTSYTKEGSYVEISGLKDEEIEKAINTKILEKFNAMYEDESIPTYRGVQQKLKEFPNPAEVYVNCNYMGNMNNLLSLSFYRTMSYSRDLENIPEDADEYYTYDRLSVSDTQTMCIDLNTGNEVSLKEMFADNVDYISLINDKLSAYLTDNNAMEENYDYYYDSNLKLVAPFESINENQKFYLDTLGNIVLIIDYENPEFYTDLYGSYYSVSMCEEMAYTERFYDGTSIFEDEVATKILPLNEFDSDTQVNEDDSTEVKPDLNVYTTKRYYSEMPEALLKVVKEDIPAETEKEIRKMAEVYDEMKAEQSNLTGYIDVNIYVSRWGQYTNIDEYCFGNISHKESYNTIKSFDYAKYRTYYGDSGKQLDIKDIFVKDADYKALLKKAFDANKDPNNRQKWSENVDDYYDAMLKTITGFSVNQMGISISYDGSVDAKTFFEDEEDMWRYTSLPQSASFKNLGYENLTIFDK